MWEANPANAIRHGESKRLAIKRLMGVFENKKHSRGAAEGEKRISVILLATVRRTLENTSKSQTRHYRFQRLAGTHFLRLVLQGAGPAEIGTSVSSGVCWSYDRRRFRNPTKKLGRQACVGASDQIFLQMTEFTRVTRLRVVNVVRVVHYTTQ